MSTRTVGRPREFDRQFALRAAVQLFWRQGYAATSLDDLLDAMQIGRSSFYASFESKHALMLEALALYTNELYGQMEAAAIADPVPERAVLSVMDIVICTQLPQYGCFFINAMMELVSSDVAVAALVRQHLARTDKLISALLVQCGCSASDARQRSGALLALASGAVALRKAGEPHARIRALLRLVPSLLQPPGSVQGRPRTPRAVRSAA